MLYANNIIPPAFLKCLPGAKSYELFTRSFKYGIYKHRCTFIYKEYRFRTPQKRRKKTMELLLPRNTVLEKTILKHGKRMAKREVSLRESCDMAGFRYGSVLKLIELRAPIFTKRKPDEYRSLCQQLALELNKPVSTLFPPEMYTGEYYAKHAKEAAAAVQRSLDENQDIEEEYAESPENIYAAKKAFAKIVGCISPREKKMLFDYFLEGSTFAEIGKAAGVSTERARKIVKRAVGKIKKKMGVA